MNLVALLSLSAVVAVNFDYFHVDGYDNPTYAEDFGNSKGLLDYMGVTPFSKETVITVDKTTYPIPKGFGEWKENHYYDCP